jgi:hypothetical protein
MSTPETPASVGSTKPAGEGISDDEMESEVADQTSPDRKAEAVFEREADGASTDSPIDQATGDDLAD